MKLKLKYAWWASLEWVLFHLSRAKLVPRGWFYHALERHTRLWYQSYQIQQNRDANEMLVELELIEESILKELEGVGVELNLLEKELSVELGDLEERIERIEHKLAIEDSLMYIDEDEAAAAERLQAALYA